jgi:hypothetical protein
MESRDSWLGLPNLNTLAPKKMFRVAVSVSVLFSILLLFFHYFSARHPFLETHSRNRGRTSFAPTASEIPNTVHFVHLLPASHGTDGAATSLEFEFRHFVSIYSAGLHLNPNKIFIHTNAAPDVIKQLRKSPNRWTRVIANLPRVVFNHETAPGRTAAGIPIDNLSDQVDFIRTSVMKRWGGVYLDGDAYILKDLAALRYSGFQNVLGKRADGLINPGIMLSTPENELLSAYHALTTGALYGDSIAHAPDLLTRLVSEFAASDRQVLVLDHEVFFSVSESEDDLSMVYKVNDLEGVNESLQLNGTNTFNLISFVHSFEQQRPETWRKDWRLAYVLHGRTVGISDGEICCAEFGGITLEYVLTKKSNFGRAVYPAVKHALDTGVIQ